MTGQSVSLDSGGGSGSGLAELIAYNGPAHAAAPFSGDQGIDGTLIGTRWTPTNTVTFSFPTATSNYGPSSSYIYPGLVDTFATFNAAQVTAARYALAQVSSFTNLDLQEITETDSVHANLRFSRSDADGINPSALGFYPATTSSGGDMWFSQNGQPFYDTPAPGNWGLATVMHEAGHALGLKHGHQNETGNDYAFLTGGPSGHWGSGPIPLAEDGQAWSLMTYRSDPANVIEFQGDGVNQPQTYMQLDIAALQYLYGADFTYNSGDTTYSFSPTTGEMFIDGASHGAPAGNVVLRTIWDGDGTDTYDFGNYSGNQSIDLNPGEFSTFSTAQLANQRAYSGDPTPAPGNIANALLYQGDQRSLIENANGGSGSDTIVGNVAANLLKGAVGPDTVTGADGNDTLDGGLDNDSLAGGDGDDVLSPYFSAFGGHETLDGGAGSDTGDWTFSPNPWTIELGAGTAKVGGGALLAVLTAIENINGGSANDIIRGDTAVNRLYGGGGDDLLDGASSYGDTLDGGVGTDTADYGWIGATDGYHPLISLVAGSFVDPSGSQFLIAIENIIGTQSGDSLVGDGAANGLDGRDGADTITGGNYNDSLTGGADDDLVYGGFGADTMVGGSGVDALDFSALLGATFLDLSSSAAQNTHSGGKDALMGFENLTTGAGDDRLFGSGQANVIASGGGADTVKAADGADVIDAGGGDDRVNAGGGDDVILGGLGRDAIRGALGTDTFDYDASAESGVGAGQRDVIRDFSSSQGDLIDLQDVIAGTFAYIGALAFTGTAAEVRVTSLVHGQLVEVDANADGVADMQIVVANEGLTGGAADFVL